MTGTNPDDQLAALIAKLPPAIEPRRDLWQRIDARIAAPTPRAPLWQLALAAGVAAAFVSVLFIGLQRNAGQTADTYRQQLDAAYLPLQQASLVRYRARADRLDPALRRTVDANLAIIDRALTEIRVALARDPDNAELGRILQRTYEQELAIVDAVTPRDVPTYQTDYRGAL